MLRDAPGCRECLADLSGISFPIIRTYTEEGNVLFNDALNTFYLRLYGVGHMVKDHSDSERARVLLYAPSNRQDERIRANTINYRLVTDVFNN